eukprot:GILK01012410.1.p1 GENE.GILK01012410.1~~GILK01012410.1.p1  ORF type:complete len:401 (+),score=53.02 GILK01012410.1:33-1205(+)
MSAVSLDEAVVPTQPEPSNSIQLYFSTSPDVHLIVGSERKRLLAHKSVLSACSCVLREKLNLSKSAPHILECPSISARVFSLLLRHMYVMDFNCSRLSFEDRMELLAAATELKVDAVASDCLKWLFYDAGDEKTLAALFEFAHQHDFEDMMLRCLHKLTESYATNKQLPLPCHFPFQLVPYVSMIQFLSNARVSFRPLQLLYVSLLWALAQAQIVTTDIEQDCKAWSVDERTTAQRLLEPLLAFIDFSEIKMEDFCAIEALQLLPLNITLARLRQHTWPHVYRIPTIQSPPVANRSEPIYEEFRVTSTVDAMDHSQNWYPAIVVLVQDLQVCVRFFNPATGRWWDDRWNEWFSYGSNRLAPLHTHTVPDERFDRLVGEMIQEFFDAMDPL